MPIILATQEAEAEVLLETRTSLYAAIRACLFKY